MRRMLSMGFLHTGQSSQRSMHRTQATAWPHGMIAAFASCSMQIEHCRSSGSRARRDSAASCATENG
jgi:hypothetical protein